MSDRLSFYIALFVFFIYKAWCFFTFPTRFTDSDQSVMWQAALDFSTGHFHHPFWYGQAYSSNFEALLAVPFIWLKMPVYQALPLASSLLSALPVILFTFLAKNIRGYQTAIFVLLLSMIFPPSFWQVSMLSRGFIQGIAFTACGIYLLSKRGSHFRLISGGFLIGAGLLQNINAIFLVIAAATMFPINRENIRSASGIFQGLLISLLIYWFLQNAVLPENVIHARPTTSWSFNTLWQNFSRLDNLLIHTTPDWFGPFTGLLIISAAIFLLNRKEQGPKRGIIALILGFIISTGMSKTSDGGNNIFFSIGRLYLSIPYALLLLSAFSTVKLSFKHSNTIFSGILITITLYAARGFKSASAEDSFGTDYAPVYHEKVTDLIAHCREIHDYSLVNNVSLVIAGDYHRLETVSCGCPTILERYPLAVRPKYERRNWIWKEIKNKKTGNVLYLDNWNSFDTLRLRLPELKQTPLKFGYLIPAGNKTPRQVMQSLFPAEQFQ